MKKNFGFSLAEIMVVVAIMGLLSAVILASINEARKNARDKTRMSDLEQVKAAMHLYAVANGTYQIPGTGIQGQGIGWLAYEDGSLYPSSIGQELVELGLLTTVLYDPLVPAGEHYSDGHRQYMVYFKANNSGVLDPLLGICLFAQLENPSAAQIANFHAVVDTMYGYVYQEHIRGYTTNYATCTS